MQHGNFQRNAPFRSVLLHLCIKFLMKSCSATLISCFCAIRNRTTFGSEDATAVMHLLGEEDKCAASALIMVPRPVRVVRRSGDVF